MAGKSKAPATITSAVVRKNPSFTLIHQDLRLPRVGSRIAMPDIRMKMGAIAVIEQTRIGIRRFVPILICEQRVFQHEQLASGMVAGFSGKPVSIVSRSIACVMRIPLITLTLMSPTNHYHRRNAL